MSKAMKELVDKFVLQGRVEWIGIRPSTHDPMVARDEVFANAEGGLDGDRYNGPAGGERQVTLFQAEHLQTIGEILRREPIDPALTRRNIVVSGVNLQAFRDREFRIGDAILRGTGHCHPCSKMETMLGPGGYSAMLGHGGLTATIVAGGTIRLNDTVELIVNQ
jgi:MOSC domain-containing protein YiiM